MQTHLLKWKGARPLLRTTTTPSLRAAPTWAHKTTDGLPESRCKHEGNYNCHKSTHWKQRAPCGLERLRSPFQWEHQAREREAGTRDPPGQTEPVDRGERCPKPQDTAWEPPTNITSSSVSSTDQISNTLELETCVGVTLRLCECFTCQFEHRKKFRVKNDRIAR